MTDPSIAIFQSSLLPTAASSPVPNRPVAARTRLMLEGPVLSTLLRLSAPNVLNLLAIAGMITFDGLFLGRLGADALTGVSLAFPFVMLIQHAANGGVGGGVSSAVARALGAGRRDRADALVHHTFILALALAALFSTTMLLGAPYVFRWMGGQGDALSAALSYANVASSGAISICMLNLLGSAVGGTGNMTLPSTVIVSSALAHVLISPVLIFGWGPIPALEEVIRVGTSYLQIVGPIYGCYGGGMALFAAMQGFGRVRLIVLANGIRLLASAVGALLAIYWLDLGAIGFFVAVALNFCASAVMAISILFKLKTPAATAL
jgi:Na+-driven multidrug efflux pump